MQQDKNLREKRVSAALGIAMVEGQKPSAKATALAQQYIDGKLTAGRMRVQYLNSLTK